MKRFAFQLDTVLRLRSHKEKDWRTRLGSITSECNRLEQEIAIMSKERTRTFQDRDENDLSWSRSNDLYIKRIEQTIDNLEKSLVVKMQEREKVLEKYQEALRDLRVIEKLREKRAAHYYKEQKYLEEKEMDEISVYKNTMKKELGNG
jgi:flagellar FliJ protein